MGVDKDNIMHSEFGSTVYSSFESMSATLDPTHWGLHAGLSGDTCSGVYCSGPNVMCKRNYM